MNRRIAKKICRGFAWALGVSQGDVGKGFAQIWPEDFAMVLRYSDGQVIEAARRWYGIRMWTERVEARRP